MNTNKLRALATYESNEHIAHELIEAAGVLDRREAVIRILEKDAHDAHQRAANAIGTRKVLWSLLGECLPLLEYDAQETHCGPSHDQIIDLIQRITDARTVVQAEELPGRAEAPAHQPVHEAKVCPTCEALARSVMLDQTGKA